MRSLRDPISTPFFSLFAAIVLTFLPGVSLVIDYARTAAHEFAHALMAILLQGSVVHLHLALDTSGEVLSRTAGMSGILVGLAGYSLAPWIGLALYRIATGSYTRAASYLMTLGLVLSIVFWVRDFQTLIVMAIIVALAASSALLKSPTFLAILGLAIFVRALSDIPPLFVTAQLTDAALLASRTYIPSIVWATIMALSALGSLYVFAGHLRPKLSKPENSATPTPHG